MKLNETNIFRRRGKHNTCTHICASESQISGLKTLSRYSFSTMTTKYRDGIPIMNFTTKITNHSRNKGRREPFFFVSLLKVKYLITLKMLYFLYRGRVLVRVKSTVSLATTLIQKGEYEEVCEAKALSRLDHQQESEKKKKKKRRMNISFFSLPPMLACHHLNPNRSTKKLARGSVWQVKW